MTNQTDPSKSTDEKPVQKKVDDASLRTWLTACDPKRVIDPSGPHYFNLDRIELAGKVETLRGDDHIDILFDVIDLSETSCQLFSGFSGTGKSTELRRLTHRLEDNGYVVLPANALDYHDLSHPLTIEDLMVISTGAFSEATTDLLGEKISPQPYWQRLREFLEREVEIGDLKVPLGSSDLKIGIKHAKSFWLELRDALASSPGKLREHSHSFVQRCVAAIIEAKKPVKGVVFVFDSLERLSGPMTNIRQIMESTVRVFTEYPEFLRLPDCHVIYTVSPYVQLISPNLQDKYDRASLVLPSVKVVERNGTSPFRPGVEALTQLVAKRLPLEQIFSSRLDLLEQLIIYSGGHVRMLLATLREILFRARRRGLPPTRSDIEKVVQPFREQARMVIQREAIPLLERIRNKGIIEELAEEEYTYLARMMDNYVVLCYRNGEDWYEIHPLVRETVERLAQQQNDDRP